MLGNQERPTFKNREDFIPLDSVDSLVLEEKPEFKDYLFFHNVLDKFCWTLKLHYSDRDTVKRKRYRIDTLFQRFVTKNKVCKEKSRKCISEKIDIDKLEHTLMKGWHNELVRNDPLHAEFLEIGTSLSRWESPGSGGLAAWNIIQSYYAFFEFMSCIGSCVKPSLDIRGPKRVAKDFNNHIIGTIHDRLLFYPFTLTSATPKNYIPDHPNFCRYHYASYPREPGRDIAELEEEVQKAFVLLGGSRRASIMDFLYEFRIWANYTGVQSLLKLSDGGYQKFLSRNLATVVYFTGGMAELAVIAAVGEKEYLKILKRFSSDYIDKHERFARCKFLIPAYIRLRSYKHLALVHEKTDFIIPNSGDPVQFIDI